jgi:hypothetical protein
LKWVVRVTKTRACRAETSAKAGGGHAVPIGMFTYGYEAEPRKTRESKRLQTLPPAAICCHLLASAAISLFSYFAGNFAFVSFCEVRYFRVLNQVPEFLISILSACLPLNTEH